MSGRVLIIDDELGHVLLIEEYLAGTATERHSSSAPMTSSSSRSIVRMRSCVSATSSLDACSSSSPRRWRPCGDPKAATRLRVPAGY
jgi:hypothetical protein